MKVLVFDNFLPDAMEERERALKTEFGTHDVYGKINHSVGYIENEKHCELFKKALGVETGTCTAYYRRYLEGEPAKEYIHNDGNVANFVGIHWLTHSSHCKGGLAFWRHKTYGWEKWPEPHDIERIGFKMNGELAKRLLDDGEEESRWEMTDYVPMAFNRMVVFLGSRYHSRYPKNVDKKTMEESRLVKAFCYTP